MSADNEAFLDRWSRLKREQAKPDAADARPAPAAAPGAPAPAAAPLPPVDALRPDSDFTPFMAPEVAPALRRAALKKLFGDAHFNVPDPFEAYSEDYTGGEAIPEAMLKAINDVRDRALRTPEERAADEAREAERAQGAAEANATGDAPGARAQGGEDEDGAGRQDA